MNHKTGLARRDTRPSKVLGLILIAGGIGWLAATAGLASISLQTMVAALLVVLGVGMIATRSSGGLILIGGVLLAYLVFGPAEGEVDIHTAGMKGAGERFVVPDSVDDLEPEYNMGVGSLTLDLAGVDLPTGVTVLDARLGMGELVIILPRAAEIEGDASAAIGEVSVFGRTRDSGIPAVATLAAADSSRPRLRVDLNVGVGSIQVRRGR